MWVFSLTANILVHGSRLTIKYFNLILLTNIHFHGLLPKQLHLLMFFLLNYPKL